MASAANDSANLDLATMRANEFAVDALKQLLTLSSVILALTITFLKDVLGEARSAASWAALIPSAWALLLVVIWLAWVAIADATRAIGTGAVSGYAFAAGRPRVLGRTAQICFVLALALLAVFAARNMGLFLASPERRVADEIRAERFVAVDKRGNIVWKVP